MPISALATRHLPLAATAIAHLPRPCTMQSRRQASDVERETRDGRIMKCVQLSKQRAATETATRGQAELAEPAAQINK